MGFYPASQLVQDARRHGVEVLPPDVNASAWDSVLTPAGEVRLGLREISGFRQGAAEQIVAARRDGAFRDVADLAGRSRLPQRDLDLLAAADALAGLAGHRRQAAWAASATAVQGDLFDGVPTSAEIPAELPAPGEGENLVADYRSLGLTLRRHPLTLLRSHLAARRFVSAADLKSAGDRALIRAAGIVTCRQRPGTASGIMFVTLEDETGLINAVVHPHLAERQRREVLQARLLGIFGQLQREGDVVHLVAKRLVDLSHWLGRLAVASRDFH